MHEQPAFYPLLPQEEQYIQQVFVQAFAGWRQCVCQPEVTAEGLTHAYASIAQVTRYHEQLAQHLPIAQVDALMLNTYSHLLTLEQQTRQQQPRHWQMVLFPRRCIPV